MAEIVKFNKGGRQKGRSLLSVIFLATLLLVLLTVISHNRSVPFIENAINRVFGIKNASFTLELDINSIYKPVSFKNSVLLVTSTGIKALEQNGSESWAQNLSIAKPLVLTGGSYLLVADRGGKTAHLFKNSSNLTSIETEDQIITAAVSEYGCFALVTAAKGYKGVITVYSSDGNPIYKWFSGDNNIIDVAINSLGNKMAVSTLETSGGVVNSKITFFDFSQETEISSNFCTDNLVASIKYNKDGSLTAIGDRAMYCYAPRGELMWTTDYEGRQLLSFCTDLDSDIVLAFSKSAGSGILSGGCDIEFYTRKGALRGSYSTQEPVKTMSGAGDSVAICLQREIVLLNSKAVERGRVVSSRDVRDITLYSDKKHVLVLSGISAEILEFGG